MRAVSGVLPSVSGGKSTGLLRGLALAALCLTTLSACTEKDKRITFEGHYFKAKAKAVERRKTVADFRVEVKDAGKSLEGARQACAYAGTRYCIENYGSSKIAWSQGPEAEVPVMDGNSMILRGVCQKP